ncbi:MAG: hypothetical protein JSS67_11530 [Bacteroidetes bacterium]|nr:hypothetical protein [Bacteroidota bacterium]
MKYRLIFFATVFIQFASSCTNSNDHQGLNDSITTIQQTDSTQVISSDTIQNVDTSKERFLVAGFNDPAGFREFFHSFQNWVNADNKDSIGAHIQFPLKNCPDIMAFKKDYQNLFNTLVKSSVAHQDPQQFFANQQGVMTGTGEIWFNEINGKYFVIAINNKPVK